MGDPVTSAGNATPTNQTTNASQSDAQSQADAQSLFEGVLKSICPPCTYQPSQSQPSKPDLQLHKDVTNPMRGPTNDPNGPGYDNYKNRTPPERDPNPLHGAKPRPGDPSVNTGPNHDSKVITVPVGKQAPKPTPEQEQNQTPYQPPRGAGPPSDFP
jgi:hypothetical protein